MSGKQHETIGVTISLLLIAILIYFQIATPGKWTIILLIGVIVGSYMPDIDSKNSKVSQVVNNIICIMLLMIFILHYTNIKQISYINDFILNITSDINKMFPFIILTILGKFSPHRMFTHKILGTSLFIFSVYFMGSDILTIGFAIGYILHILADRTTAAGKNLHFFEIKLPMMNSKNKFNVYF